MSDLFGVLAERFLPNGGMTPDEWMDRLEECLERARVELIARAARAGWPEERTRTILATFDALRRQVASEAPNRGIAYADSILALAPSACCAGSVLLVRCLNTTPTSDPVLLPVFDTRRRPIWRPYQANSIPAGTGESVFALEVPTDARRGPVGFLHADVKGQWETFVGWLNRTTRSYADRIPPSNPNERGRQVSMLEALLTIPLRPPSDRPLETGRNLFHGSKPEVEAFQANGAAEAVLQPGETVRLTWQVWNAQEIRIKKRLGPDWNVLHVSTGSSGQFEYTPTTDQCDQTLWLQAVNGCGAVSATVTLHLRIPTNVTVFGVEAVQSVQEFSFDSPTRRNVIPLFKRKRTLVRVYLDSGLPPNFNLGVLNDVSGELWVGGARVPALKTACVSRNPSGSRNDLLKSVNFLIDPQWLQGDRLSATIKVFSSDPHAMWSTVSTSIDLALKEPVSFDLQIVRVIDREGRQPNDAEVQASLDKLAAILPVATYGGLKVKGQYVLETDLDFNNPDAWFHVSPFSRDLFDLMEGQAQAIGDKDAIYCGIVARSACSVAKGRGWAGGLDAVGGSSERIAYWRASLPEEANFIEAHEFGHACNLLDNSQAQSAVGVDLSRPLHPRLVMAADQLMDGTSEERWASAAEYLWFFYRDIFKVMRETNEHELGGNINVVSIAI